MSTGTAGEKCPHCGELCVPAVDAMIGIRNDRIHHLIVHALQSVGLIEGDLPDDGPLAILVGWREDTWQDAALGAIDHLSAVVGNLMADENKQEKLNKGIQWLRSRYPTTQAQWKWICMVLDRRELENRLTIAVPRTWEHTIKTGGLLPVMGANSYALKGWEIDIRCEAAGWLRLYLCRGEMNEIDGYDIEDWMLSFRIRDIHDGTWKPLGLDGEKVMVRLQWQG